MNAELVLGKLRSIGYQIRTDGKDIILTAEKNPDREQATALLAELRCCKQEAVQILQGWPVEVQTLLDWFRSAPIPQAPFQLNACTTVINADTFYAALRREIESGPRGARARYGTLRGDLVDLAKLQ
ncbi:MAG: hypothetical protein L6300_09185 [Syntrophaceae bacterium]|nr:hypothetical protein [Syntrophaceae bacterium]